MWENGGDSLKRAVSLLSLPLSFYVTTSLGHCAPLLQLLLRLLSVCAKYGPKLLTCRHSERRCRRSGA
jgi:hypothetical protein